jgi:hypothetical protein
MVKIGGRSLGGKREFLARGFLWSGASFLLSQLPARDSLLVLNYHRIGNPDDDLFDPGIFSATAEEFGDQIAHLKRYLSPVTLEEALAFAAGTLKDKARRCRVLITLDDGYLDNYSIAYPILRSHGIQGTGWLLPASLVGPCCLCGEDCSPARLLSPLPGQPDREHRSERREGELARYLDAMQNVRDYRSGAVH